MSDDQSSNDKKYSIEHLMCGIEPPRRRTDILESDVPKPPVPARNVPPPLPPKQPEPPPVPPQNIEPFADVFARPKAPDYSQYYSSMFQQDPQVPPDLRQPGGNIITGLSAINPAPSATVQKYLGDFNTGHPADSWNKAIPHQDAAMAYALAMAASTDWFRLSPTEAAISNKYGEAIWDYVNRELKPEFYEEQSEGAVLEPAQFVNNISSYVPAPSGAVAAHLNKIRDELYKPGDEGVDELERVIGRGVASDGSVVGIDDSMMALALLRAYNDNPAGLSRVETKLITPGLIDFVEHVYGETVQAPEMPERTEPSPEQYGLTPEQWDEWLGYGSEHDNQEQFHDSVRGKRMSAMVDAWLYANADRILGSPQPDLATGLVEAIRDHAQKSNMARRDVAATFDATPSESAGELRTLGPKRGSEVYVVAAQDEAAGQTAAAELIRDVRRLSLHHKRRKLPVGQKPPRPVVQQEGLQADPGSATDIGTVDFNDTASRHFKPRPTIRRETDKYYLGGDGAEPQDMDPDADPDDDFIDMDAPSTGGGGLSKLKEIRDARKKEAEQRARLQFERWLAPWSPEDVARAKYNAAEVFGVSPENKEDMRGKFEAFLMAPRPNAPDGELWYKEEFLKDRNDGEYYAEHRDYIDSEKSRWTERHPKPEVLPGHEAYTVDGGLGTVNVFPPIDPRKEQPLPLTCSAWFDRPEFYLMANNKDGKVGLPFDFDNKDPYSASMHLRVPLKIGQEVRHRIDSDICRVGWVVGYTNDGLVIVMLHPPKLGEVKNVFAKTTDQTYDPRKLTAKLDKMKLEYWHPLDVVLPNMDIKANFPNLHDIMRQGDVRKNDTLPPRTMRYDWSENTVPSDLAPVHQPPPLPKKSPPAPKPPPIPKPPAAPKPPPQEPTPLQEPVSEPEETVGEEPRVRRAGPYDMWAKSTMGAMVPIFEEEASKVSPIEPGRGELLDRGEFGWDSIANAGEYLGGLRGWRDPGACRDALILDPRKINPARLDKGRGNLKSGMVVAPIIQELEGREGVAVGYDSSGYLLVAIRNRARAITGVERWHPLSVVIVPNSGIVENLPSPADLNRHIINHDAAMRRRASGEGEDMNKEAQVQQYTPPTQMSNTQQMQPVNMGDVINATNTISQMEQQRDTLDNQIQEQANTVQQGLQSVVPNQAQQGKPFTPVAMCDIKD